MPASASAASSKQRVELPPHPISELGQTYLQTLSKEDLELHRLATELLGSSYFVERSKGFQSWLAAAAAKQKQNS
jgi:hypothetical protein